MTSVLMTMTCFCSDWLRQCRIPVQSSKVQIIWLFKVVLLSGTHQPQHCGCFISKNCHGIIPVYLREQTGPQSRLPSERQQLPQCRLPKASQHEPRIKMGPVYNSGYTSKAFFFSSKTHWAVLGVKCSTKFKFSFTYPGVCHSVAWMTELTCKPKHEAPYSLWVVCLRHIYSSNKRYNTLINKLTPIRNSNM